MKTILVDAVNTFVIAGEGISDKIHELLEKYPNKKIILTNADDEQILTFGLDKMPYEVFTLKHAPEKTDPEYFKKMLSHFDLAVADVVYFEHNLEAVESARSVGIATHFYDKDKKDLTALAQFLEENLS